MRGPGRRRAANRDYSTQDDIDLRYAWAGAHFQVFIDMPEELVIFDILRERSDLPARPQRPK